MRVQITVIALLAAVGIAVMLVGGKNPEALADSQSSTQDGSSGIVTSETVLGEPGVLRNKPGSGFGYGLGLRVKSSFGLFSNVTDFVG